MAEIGSFQGTSRFELVRRLGQGGMGVVYLAYDHERQGNVALKTLLVRSAESILLFKHEFRALQDIQHPNLVRLGEMFDFQGVLFFTMELVEGCNFLQYIYNQSSPATAPDASLHSSTRGQGSETPWDVSLDPPGEIDETSDFRASPTRQGFLVSRISGHRDEARLRAAFGQLARGLCALHEARKVHRDIKPSNVMVTNQGRVVILDFGIISDAEQIERWGVHQTMGTAAYMAPEQSQGAPANASTDWYAAGVMLFEALTGQLPFDGQPELVIARKCQQKAPHPGSLVSELPQDLEQLCVDLLQQNPAARPKGAEILVRLQITRTVDEPVVAPENSQFTGRENELAALAVAFAEVRAGRGVTVLVHGPSGIGKSQLVRYFIERLIEQDARLVVLKGRCYEREAIAYKAVDNVIDQLSGYLGQLPESALTHLLPPNIELLAQVFPVLETVAERQKTPPPPVPVDAVELRLRVFAALRELLSGLARTMPLVLVIDDLQWSDSDSFVLLAEVLRLPDPPAMLLLATVREDSGVVPEKTGGGLLARLSAPVRHLYIEKLDESAARQLAIQLLGVGADEAVAEQIAREAQGHPLFIDALVRQRSSLGDKAAYPRLDEALWARVARLETPARQLLELVAIAGRPIAQGIAMRAAALKVGDFDRLLAHLRTAHLVRSNGSGVHDTIEPYHDRVRESVVGSLDLVGRRDWHARLAVVLEAEAHSDAEALLTHWEEAGQPQKAAQYALRAAEQARAALAFDRAARLYQRVLDLGAVDTSQRRTVQHHLAEALVHANRGREAVPIFLDIAQQAEPEISCQLRLRAAELLLRTGQKGDADILLRRVFGELGIYYPDTPRRALGMLILRRIQLKLRGLAFIQRPRESVSPELLLRIEACRAASFVGRIDYIYWAELQNRYLLWALGAGQVEQVADGLLGEVISLTASGSLGDPRAAPLLERVRELTLQTAKPYLQARFAQVEALYSHLRGRFKEARVLLDRAEQLFRQNCSGIASDLAHIHQGRAVNNMYLGEIRSLTLHARHELKEAEERDDNFATTNLRTQIMPLVYLAEDDVEQARQIVNFGISQWSPEGFHFQHFQAMYSLALVDLYADLGTTAYQRLTEARKQIKKSLVMMQIQVVRIQGTEVFGRSALAAAQLNLATQGHLLRVAEKAARQLEQEKVGWADSLALLLRAGIMATRGKPQAALAFAQRAATSFASVDMQLHAAVARWRQGELLNDEGGQQMIHAAAEVFKRQAIRNPARWVKMMSPGFVSPTEILV